MLPHWVDPNPLLRCVGWEKLGGKLPPPQSASRVLARSVTGGLASGRYFLICRIGFPTILPRSTIRSSNNLDELTNRKDMDSLEGDALPFPVGLFSVTAPLISMSLRQTLAYLWASPYTLLGIAMGLLLGGRFRVVSGVIEIHGPWISAVLRKLLVPALAMTLGHVVLGQNSEALDRTRIHERVHVGQYERWGISFVPVYLFWSLLLSLRGRDGYLENPFEIEAYAADDCQGNIATDIMESDDRA